MATDKRNGLAQRNPRHRNHVGARVLLAGIALCLGTRITPAQQIPDLAYRPQLPSPAFASGEGPRIGIDEAHHNFHTADGRYRPFADLLRRDGYRVAGFGEPFTPDGLKAVDVLVVANALNERNAEDWSLPTPSAFARDEIAAVHRWVEEGGALLLIADHMPFPGAMSDLARTFGIVFSNGYARPGKREPGICDRFERGAGFEESAVTRGRSENENVSGVATFGGSAFKPPMGAIPILVFGANSVSEETTKAPGITPGAPVVPIEGWCQGAILQVGSGRIAVFGEAAMFSAQLAGREERPMGMNSPEAAQNHQLLLNVMHWLTRVKGCS
jgi:hypothetical protein